VALEELVKARYELPGYSTLDRAATTTRTKVNQALFAEIEQRVEASARDELLGLLHVDAGARRSPFDELKWSARRPSLSRLKEHTQTLIRLDEIGATDQWLGDLAPVKASHFAGEARVLDASDMRKISETKRLALLVCLVHQARIRGRDELAEMVCRRMATIHKRGRDDLADIRDRQRNDTKRLWSVFGDVLSAARQATASTADDETDDNAASATGLDDEAVKRAGALMLESLAAGGGLDRLTREHSYISAHHGNNYMPLLARRFRSHRKALFDVCC